MAWLHGKFVWYEHVSPDPESAARFYAELIGWQVEDRPVDGQPYRAIVNGGEGIGGFRDAPAGLPARWLSYLSVPDVDAAFAAALAAGAVSELAPHDFGEIGRGAALADPTGARLALWKGAGGDRPDVEATPRGDWYWTELITPDETKALAFYETAFGFTHDTLDMGAQGPYYLLLAGGKLRAGLARATDDMPPLWLPYVRVDDADASAAQAVALGAQIRVPPTDVPDVGRFAMLIDPFGAAIALMRARPGA